MRAFAELSRLRWAFCLAALLAVLGSVSQAQGALPNDPQARELVTKARGFLQNAKGDQLGEKCLIALALLKSGSEQNEPRIVEAVNEALKAANDPNQFNNFGIARNYNLALTLIFLSDLDPQKYRPQIERLVGYLQSRQQPSGGFGYNAGDEFGHGKPADGGTGDTSQTQYAVLGMWAAKHGGVPVPQSMVEQACQWLINTQDPSGAWGYQGRVSPGDRMMPQAEVRDSLVVAGLSSVYICADLLSVFETDSSGLPGAFEAADQSTETRFRNPRVNRDAVKRACALGDQWIAKNYKGYESTKYEGRGGHYFTIFYMYGMERYQSFRETVLKKPEPSPAWYRDGVSFLAKHQREDGSWQAHRFSAVDTALAVLFLVRSTKASIEKNWGSGTLTGGRGLPTDLANARVKDNKIVGEPISGTVDELVTILENPNHANYEALVNNPESLLASAKVANENNEAADRLRKLVATGDYQARQAAVRALGRTGNLDNVPTLVFAITDPDWRVVLEARNGLRFISRKFDAFGMPEEPTDKERIEAIKKWKEWYLSIRPHAEWPEIPPIAPSGG